jgi:manganese/zinc/iron transport system substrate-binding protein
MASANPGDAGWSVCLRTSEFKSMKPDLKYRVLSRRGVLAAMMLIGGAIASVAGCGFGSASSDGRIRVVATTGMVADLVERVGGKHVNVQQLMAAGIDPHQYKAVPSDVTACHEADLIFYNGLHLEGKLADLFEKLAAKKPTYAVAGKLPEAMLLHSDGAHDPHVWFDVSLWRQTIAVVRDALIDFDPTNVEEFRANAAAYESELDKLHEECQKLLAEVPKERRVLVTAHDAFQYFGRAYDIEVHGIQGISTESEASTKEKNKLVDLLVQRKIKAVFVETSVSERNIESLLEGCSAQGHDVRIGGELFSDAMGEKGKPEGKYPGMVRHNVKTIVEALK